MDNIKIKILKKIYREAFNDEDTIFENLLFENCIEYCRFIEENDVPVSMFFALPCILKGKEKEFDAIYFYAAATNKKYRGRGYMGKLIEELKLSENLIFLRPGEESLIEYYKRFGFETALSSNDFCDFELIPTKGFKKLTEKIKNDYNFEEFILMYYSDESKKFNKIKFPFSMN